MKTLYHLLTLVMGLILFVSCDKESEVLQNPEEKILKIQVTDKGYASDPANKETKAIDEEFNTTFENGDKIGVFIVDEDGSITYANVPVTLKDNVWVDETQGVRIKSTTEKVFAYYPYVEDSKINDLVSPETESESDFFAGYINSLDISDQSTLSRYRQADVLGCMVEKASISEGTITFNMSHLMGLVVLDFDVKQMIDFTLESDPDYTWRRTLPVSVNMQLNNGKLMVKQGEALAYYYLVNPNEVQTLNGEISKDNEVQSFVLSELPAASLCKSYLVTATLQTIGKDTHKLQIGDIFKSDGGLISQAEFSGPGVSAAEKADCVGIVFQTYYENNSTSQLTNRIGNAEIQELQRVTGDNQYLPHGLVMALKDAGTHIKWSTLSSTNTGIPDAGTVELQKADINGLSNNQIIRNIDGYQNTYPAFNVAQSFNVAIPQNKTTGWFLPSIGQLMDFVINIGEVNFENSMESIIDGIEYNYYVTPIPVNIMNTINTKIEVVGSGNYDMITNNLYDNIYTDNKVYCTVYWSSTEGDDTHAKEMDFRPDIFYFGHFNKNFELSVRSVLAF